MAHDISWPPTSPHAALLSSPSGRKKYEACQKSLSMKHSATTPSLVDRLRAARRGNDLSSQDESVEDMEEDEETLQLQLAAIEAKLKLKKLQKNKTRAATPARDSSRPSSAHGSTSTNSYLFSRRQEPTLEPSQVEVNASPTKRSQPNPHPKSPSRVLLGIDKGIRGADISLRRANTTASSARQRKEFSVASSGRPSSRSSAFDSVRSATLARSAICSDSRKTFSERMAEAREQETDRAKRRETIIQNRSKGFRLDPAEIDSYKLQAEHSRNQEPPKSPTRRHIAYSRDEILNSATDAKPGLRDLRKSRTTPDLRESSSRQETDDLNLRHADVSLFEGFSQLHLSSRILPHSFLNRTLPTDRFTIYRVPDLLKHVKSPTYELPDTVCDYVVCGVIASKSSAMDHKTPAPDSATVGTKDWERQWEDGSRNQRRFMAFTLTDLKWTVDIYLFGTALPRYHRLTPGTVVAILNPGIMPPKPGQTHTGAFSLALHDGDDTILEIGTARDLGYCKTLKKDGKECGGWLDASKTGICEWHLNAQLEKTRAKRMGVNTGTNGRRNTFFEKGKPGKNGLALREEGRGYDWASQSQYYISHSGASSTNKGNRYGRAMTDTDDAFIPEGHFSRPNDRDARVRKHLAAQEKEREIAEKLGSRDHIGFGSAGAEYLRQKARAAKEAQEEDPSSSSANFKDGDSQAGRHRSALLSKTILTSTTNGTNGNGKRTAADVRLSPVKKTRFVTDKGIREAGRESLGAPATRPDDESGSEDELEIV